MPSVHKQKTGNHWTATPKHRPKLGSKNIPQMSLSGLELNPQWDIKKAVAAKEAGNTRTWLNPHKESLRETTGNINQRS